MVTKVQKRSLFNTNGSFSLLMVLLEEMPLEQHGDQSYLRKGRVFRTNANFKEDETYLQQDVVKTVFIIGQSSKKEISDLVETEAKIFGDIVIGGLHEHYRNLTMKTRLGLKWAYHHCKAKYILKTDDDVFINPFPLVEWLKVQKRDKFYSGWCNSIHQLCEIK